MPAAAAVHAVGLAGGGAGALLNFSTAAACPAPLLQEADLATVQADQLRPFPLTTATRGPGCSSGAYYMCFILSGRVYVPRHGGNRSGAGAPKGFANNPHMSQVVSWGLRAGMRLESRL